MDKLITFRNAVLWAATLLVVGCSGITPYDPPDDRDNPPGRDLLSGADGEFVIYQKPEEVDADGETIKNKEQ
jgi:hypothetical protein